MNKIEITDFISNGNNIIHISRNDRSALFIDSIDGVILSALHKPRFKVVGVDDI